MNELIQELLQQSTDNVLGVPVVNQKKFAELIVQGCADIINHRADTCGDRLDSIKANKAVREAQRECAKTIKQHFGVEE
jgi:hypothetical protein